VEATIDSVGRIVVPKPLRDAIGLVPGSTVDISQYGPGLQLVPVGRTARLVDESGVLVATGETTIDDDVVFGLIDYARIGHQRCRPATRADACRSRLGG
jgi:AbrB family looped-hinge helix DNA binding protein